MLQCGHVRARREHLRQELLLADQDPGFRVPEEVLDLLGCVGRVDRERRRAQHHPREVADVELGAVGEHQGERVPPLQAELGQPGREGVDAIAQLAPRDREGIPARADGDLVETFGGGDPKRLGNRPGAGRRPPLGHGIVDCGLHNLLLPLTVLLPGPGPDEPTAIISARQEQG